MSNWFKQSKQAKANESGYSTPKSKEYRRPYRKSLKCYVTIIFKTSTLNEYYHEGLNVEIPQKKKNLMFLVPDSNSVKFRSYKPDADGNYYVYIAHVPSDKFEEAFEDQIYSDDYDGTVDADDVNFWFDPLDIDMYNRLLARLNDNTTQYYKVLRDGSFQLHYSNYRGDLE